VSLNSSTFDGWLFVSVVLRLPTIDVTGVACKNRQILTATPIVWSEGM